MDQLLTQFTDLSATQVIALFTGVVYVLLAARQKSLCWVFGIMSCALIAWDDFTVFRLYADGVLQLLYVVLGFVGLYQWQFGSGRAGTHKIQHIPVSAHVLAVFLALVASVPLAWLLRTYTDAVFSYFDTLTTLLSIYATWLLVCKVLENWLYWIVIDAVYVYLFLNRGGALIGVLYAVYFGVAIYAYLHWRGTMHNDQIVEIESN